MEPQTVLLPYSQATAVQQLHYGALKLLSVRRSYVKNRTLCDNSWRVMYIMKTFVALK